MRYKSRSCRGLHQALKIDHPQLRRVKEIIKPISSSCQISNLMQIQPLYSRPFTSSVSSLIPSRCLWSYHQTTSTQLLFHSACHLLIIASNRCHKTMHQHPRSWFPPRTTTSAISHRCRQVCAAWRWAVSRSSGRPCLRVARMTGQRRNLTGKMLKLHTISRS
jgi:hypothetical protein